MELSLFERSVLILLHSAVTSDESKTAIEVLRHGSADDYANHMQITPISEADADLVRKTLTVYRHLKRYTAAFESAPQSAGKFHYPPEINHAAYRDSVPHFYDFGEPKLDKYAEMLVSREFPEHSSTIGKRPSVMPNSGDYRKLVELWEEMGCPKDLEARQANRLRTEANLPTA